MPESYFDSLLSKSGYVSINGELVSPDEIYKRHINLVNQRTKNNMAEIVNSVENHHENAYNYIEYILDRDAYIEGYTDNDREGIRLIRENNSFFESTLSKRKYEKILLDWIKYRVLQPSLPGCRFSSVIADGILYEFLRQVTDYDERGYRSTVIPRRHYEENRNYYDKRIRDKDSFFNIGDCYWGGLQPFVEEFDKRGNLIGIYSECAVSSIHKSFSGCKDFFLSDLSRAIGYPNSIYFKSQIFSFKIVDIIWQAASTIYVSHVNKAIAERGIEGLTIDCLDMHVLDSYSKDNEVYKYGSAVTDEEVFNEYLLWQLNNHFFLRYDLKKSNHSYSEMLKLKRDYDFINLLKKYKIPCDIQELKGLNNELGEQNTGVITNKILQIEFALINRDRLQ